MKPASGAIGVPSEPSWLAAGSYGSKAMLLAASLSLVIGLALGMLGGGGAILTLPMLVYAVGVEPKAAIAASLFVVGATSAVGAAINARAKNVEWKVGLTFGAAAMAGAFGGGRLASLVPATVLLGIFAVMMLVTATAMLRGRAEPAIPRPLVISRVLALGAGVGILSGLVGAGGGFLIVPALSLFGGVPLRKAIGTSLFVIALQSFAGFAGHVTHVTLDWPLVAVVTAAAVAGTVVGVFAGKKVPVDVLRRGFAWLVIAMGLFVIGKQVSFVITVLVALFTLTAIVISSRGRPQPPRESSCTTSNPSPR